MSKWGIQDIVFCKGSNRWIIPALILWSEGFEHVAILAPIVVNEDGVEDLLIYWDSPANTGFVFANNVQNIEQLNRETCHCTCAMGSFQNAYISMRLITTK